MKTYARREIIGSANGGETLKTLAHDLRTPMSSVVCAAQLALLCARKEKAGDATAVIERQMQQILQAVGAMDSVLRAACEERNSVLIPQELEQELCAVIAPKAGEKEIRLLIDLRPLRGQVFHTDGAAVTRILLNLLGNAVKFTPEAGWVSLRGELRPGLRPMQGRRLVFSVRDSGMGMTEEFMEAMYNQHARAKETAQLPGEGLGLAIVRRLVDELGGTIGVQSEPGQGTTFTVAFEER